MLRTTCRECRFWNALFAKGEDGKLKAVQSPGREGPTGEMGACRAPHPWDDDYGTRTTAGDCCRHWTRHDQPRIGLAVLTKKIEGVGVEAGTGEPFLANPAMVTRVTFLRDSRGSAVHFSDGSHEVVEEDPAQTAEALMLESPVGVADDRIPKNYVGGPDTEELDVFNNLEKTITELAE